MLFSLFRLLFSGYSVISWCQLRMLQYTKQCESAAHVNPKKKFESARESNDKVHCQSFKNETNLVLSNEDYSYSIVNSDV